MASLFVKNDEAAALAAEVAELRGVTKSVAVIEALRKERDALRPPLQPKGKSLIERMDQYRNGHPLPPKVREADKAFFDRLWGEPED
ncbi:antitoxin VapB [Sphingomonas vulcanisoli]|uniref:Antitoxin VapB n=1 Tax=Sphingomonas vulcanisoli TaxID=1658060 RepID=A0ABX0TUN4_9SPHN|nr:type II toxin-antitoxin system VapB family antitoxin [Sphingomonas vulcanisoli]NIJ08180.1 antitoxin VapB [Sphingomonas vulcanisoli]